MSVRALWCSGIINKSWLPLKRLLSFGFFFFLGVSEDLMNELDLF